MIFRHNRFNFQKVRYFLNKVVIEISDPAHDYPIEYVTVNLDEISHCGGFEEWVEANY